MIKEKLIELLQEHQSVQTQLSHLKNIEMELRKKIVDHYKKEDKLKIGTNNFDIDGQLFSIVESYAYTIDGKVFNEIRTKLDNESLKCIALKPTLSLSLYKELKSKHQHGLTLDECIIVKPAAPQVKYK